MGLSRTESLARLREREFDLLVIGGGITGAGIAQDAALRGLEVGLVEKTDFAAGTTHSSSKLLHGGLRYLEQFHLELMYEALHERNRLIGLAPELAEWLPFILPIYRRGWSSLRLRIGLTLYDLLAGRPKGRTHRRISRARALELAPYLDRRGLKGALLYYDARTSDTRLTLAVLRSAAIAGAAITNYTEVIDFTSSEGHLTGARVRDRLTGAEFEVRARTVVNATGVWADQIAHLADPDSPSRLVPSKGVHLVFRAERLGIEPSDFPSAAAVFAPTPQGDGRYLFVIPWQGLVLIGPTDTPYAGDPDQVGVEDDDIDYILTAANGLYPDLGLTHSDIVSTLVGLRPLIGSEGESTSKISREHEVWEGPSGLISIAGGKLTTYRTMAIGVVDRILRRLGLDPIPSVTAETPLPDPSPYRYEGGSSAIERPTREEILYSAAEEMAIYPDDFLCRRTSLGIRAPELAAEIRDEIGEILADYRQSRVAPE